MALHHTDQLPEHDGRIGADPTTTTPAAAGPVDVTPSADAEGAAGDAVVPLTPFECTKATEEACATGNQCYNTKLKCDGGEPDCADGSDEAAAVCSRLQATADAGNNATDGGGTHGEPDSVGGSGSDTVTLGIIGAVVGIGACGILAYLFVNGCFGKGGGGAGQAVNGFSLNFANPAYNTDNPDGELYGNAAPSDTSAGAMPDGEGGDQSYADMGPTGGGSYANVVDGDDGGYMLTPATGATPGPSTTDTVGTRTM